MEINILGTACMQPTRDRNHVGILVSYKKEKILFECGENIQRQLRIANLKPAKITKIFISHWHGDHVLGLPGLLSSMGADQNPNKIEIYGPEGIKKQMEYVKKAFPSKKWVDYQIIEIKNKQKIEFEDFYIESDKLDHGIACLGYSFVEKDKRKIKSKYINKIPGLLLGKLQKNKTIIHEGKKITPDDATLLIKGKKLTIIMDTRPCNNFTKLAKNSDLLISEATFLEEHKEKAEEYYHLTAQEVGLLANQAQVKKLVLLHFSQRYKNIGNIRNEVEKVFQNCICAEDFMKFKI